ncbi:MAG TPA: DNA double-strand break repair nuclease NurA [Anaerolineales bacterium]|nr:DNA double-strand break repair nuclease NurA [Anaerolineales bacterium]
MLDLSKLVREIPQLARSYRQEHIAKKDALQVAREKLGELEGLMPLLTQRLAQVAQSKINWQGAFIASEVPAHQTIPPPDLPARYDLLAVDGSQIYPNRHSPILYYLLNIGSIFYQHGVNIAPQVESQPQIFFHANDLYTDPDRLIDTALVNAKRDVAEIQTLAEKACQYRTPQAPCIALLDNSLKLFIPTSQNTHTNAWQLLSEAYNTAKQTLQANDIILAGVIDRSQAQAVLRLLQLAQAAQLDEISLKLPDSWAVLTDAELFGNLPEHHRSTLFTTPLANDPASLQNTYFFYLNIGGKDIVRVEVPEWVTALPEAINTLHASLIHQARVGGFPYALTRAHELAVVSQADKAELEAFFSGELLKQDLFVLPSAKQIGKNQVSR